jgi:MFS family permease
MFTEHHLRYEGWRVTLAASVGVFVSFASLLVYTFGVFLKPLTVEFGWSREAVSSAFGFAALMIAVASPILGLLFDRFGPRRIIAPCMVIFGGAFASLAWLTPSLTHLYVIFIVLGLVGNGTAQMAYSRAVSSWFDQRRGMAFALLLCGGSVGAMALPPIAQALIAGVGWRSAALTLGVGAVAIGLPTLLLFVRERPRDSRSARTPAYGASIGEGLQSRTFWILVIVLFVSSIAQNGAIAHLAALLTDRGVAPEEAAMALSAMGGASLVGRLTTGWLLDRFFAGRVSFGLLAIAALGAFLLSGASTLPMGLLAAALIGFGMGGEADVTPYLLSRYFGLRAFSTLYGLTWTAYAIAGALGPILMGKAFDATGSYERLLVVLALGTLASGVLMLWLPRYSDAVRAAASAAANAASVSRPESGGVIAAGTVSPVEGQRNTTVRL